MRLSNPPSAPSSLSRHRTFRWNDGRDVTRYQAVETSERGLRWFGWSHAPEDGGLHDEATQSFADFLRNGPSRAAPPHVMQALKRWIDEHVLAP